MVDPLILAEYGVGKQEALRTHLQAAIWEVVHVNVFAAQLLGRGVSFQDDPLTVVRQSQLAADVTLLAMAQDISELVFRD